MHSADFSGVNVGMRNLLVVTMLALPALLGCDERPVRALNSELRAEPASIDFGTAAPAAIVTRSLTLTNHGGATVTLQRVLLAEPTGPFSARTPSANVLPTGASATVEVSFVGLTEDGVSSGRLIIESDASNAPSLEVPLTARTLKGADAGERDAGEAVEDAGVVVDAGVTTDAGAVDAGAVDAGAVDSGVTVDAGVTMDAGVVDAGVVDAGPAWVELGVGEYHACGLRADGQPLCWGSNDEQQVGPGPEEALTPQPISGLGDVADFALGIGFSCARLTSGGVRCWGDNSAGQLGNGGQPTTSATPMAVTGLSDATALVAGDAFACALRATGDVVCWGANGSLQLGIGSASPAFATTPQHVAGLGQVVELRANRMHACARRTTGEVLCWGNNSYGHLGAPFGNRSSPTPLTAFTDIAHLAVGDTHTCVRHTTGAVSCIGRQDLGQLGNGQQSISVELTPQAVVGLSDAVELRAAARHTCARRASGAVVCWGANNGGQLGNGRNDDAATLVPVTGLGDATALRVGNTSSCALRSNGDAVCWGFNPTGQLGGGFMNSVLTASPVVSLPAAVHLASSWESSCAVTTPGTVKCWGDNDHGQLGDGTMVSRYTPVDVVGVTGAVAVALGHRNGCAIVAGGALQCWGDNTFGELGIGTTQPVVGPVTVPSLGGVAQVTGGSSFVCARLGTGAVWCWGGNIYGQLGDGSTATRASPVAVSGVSDAVSLATGPNHSCVARANGSVQCWGQDTDG